MIVYPTDTNNRAVILTDHSVRVVGDDRMIPVYRGQLVDVVDEVEDFGQYFVTLDSGDDVWVDTDDARRLRAGDLT